MIVLSNTMQQSLTHYILKCDHPPKTSEYKGKRLWKLGVYTLSGERPKMELARQSGAKTIWGRATRTTSSLHHNSPTGQNQIKQFFFFIKCFVSSWPFNVGFSAHSNIDKYWIFSNSPLTIKDNFKGCVYFVKWCNMWNNRSLLFRCASISRLYPCE